MISRILALGGISIAVALAQSSTPAPAKPKPPAAAKAKPATASNANYVPPKTSWGEPDLQGIWPLNHLIAVPLTRPARYANKANLSDEEIAAALRARGHFAGEDLIISINQNVPSCVAVGTNNGCRPNPAYGNNSQYSPLAHSVYHGLHLSLMQRPSKWGTYRVGYTLSKAMNNVGENFFSSPIDPFDINKDWGRSDDDQRHRLVVNGCINSPTSPARTGWEMLTHGFQVSGVLQAYSALPFNITSGVTTVQGTAGRPIVDGAFIERNAGVGSAFFTTSLRVSRSFRLGGSAQAEGLLEVFNLTNHRNDLTRNGNFGSGAYPTNPSPTFNQITAVGDPRSLQFGVRFRF